MDAYRWLNEWLAYLPFVYGRPLEPDDHIFPAITVGKGGKTFVVDPSRPMSHDTWQTLLTDYTSKAGIGKHFSTHGFRRGGAQYRFLFAPPGRKWPLHVVSWWGGWALGEYVRLFAISALTPAPTLPPRAETNPRQILVRGALPNGDRFPRHARTDSLGHRQFLYG